MIQEEEEVEEEVRIGPFPLLLEMPLEARTPSDWSLPPLQPVFNQLLHPLLRGRILRTNHLRPRKRGEKYKIITQNVH
jgi:hypothetical protein